MLRIKKQQIDGTLFFGLKRSEYIATALSISMPVEPVHRTNLANISSIQLINPCFWMYFKAIPFMKIFRTIHNWQLYWGWSLSQAPGNFFVNTTVLNLIYLLKHPWWFSFTDGYCNCGQFLPCLAVCTNHSCLPQKKICWPLWQYMWSCTCM
jgi:hypothetical protein